MIFINNILKDVKYKKSNIKVNYIKIIPFNVVSLNKLFKKSYFSEKYIVLTLCDIKLKQ